MASGLGSVAHAQPEMCPSFTITEELRGGVCHKKSRSGPTRNRVHFSTRITQKLMCPVLGEGPVTTFLVGRRNAPQPLAACWPATHRRNGWCLNDSCVIWSLGLYICKYMLLCLFNVYIYILCMFIMLTHTHAYAYHACLRF